MDNLPFETKSLVARYVGAKLLLPLACSNKAWFHASVPFMWRNPKLSPLVPAHVWDRFLDSIAMSRLGVTGFDYASCIQRVTDLGMCIGMEDCVDRSLQRRDSKLDGMAENPQGDVLHHPRRSFLLSESVSVLDKFPINSLHYALALVLTHCQNLKELSIQLPLPPVESSFPLRLSNLLNLSHLTITTRVSDTILNSIFACSLQQSSGGFELSHLELPRLEVSPDSLIDCWTSLNASKLKCLLLPSTRPVKSHSFHDIYSGSTQTRRVPIPSGHCATPGVLKYLASFENLSKLDISGLLLPVITSNSLVEEVQQDVVSPLLECLQSLNQLCELALAVSTKRGISVPAICTHLLPHLPVLQSLTLKSTCFSDDYAGDMTLEEEEVLKLPLYWTKKIRLCEWSTRRNLILIGFDFVTGGVGGMMRTYYSCHGPNTSMLSEFRTRFENIHGGEFSLSVVQE